VTITTNIEKTERTTRQVAEAQRDAYEALAENFSAAQRRNVEFAQGGLEFLRLQQDSARAAQELFANGVRVLQLQQRDVRFTQNWLSGGVELLREQAEHNRRTVEAFARSGRKQQEGFRSLAEGWTRAYRDFFSPFAYAQEGLKVTQQATRQGLQVAEQGLRAAEETSTQTEEALRQVEEATHKAELQATVLRVLKAEDYDALTVAEFSRKLDGLSVRELKQVREYEKQNKNRETLLEQIDRKIKAVS
jgi:hypothetical protein